MNEYTEQLSRDLTANRLMGGTWSMDGSPVPESGYVVSDPRYTFVLGPGIDMELIVPHWVAALPPDVRYVGVWTDGATGAVHVDVNDIIPDLDAAVRTAQERREIAIWDLARNEEIRMTDEELLLHKIAHQRGDTDYCPREWIAGGHLSFADQVVTVWTCYLTQAERDAVLRASGSNVWSEDDLEDLHAIADAIESETEYRWDEGEVFRYPPCPLDTPATD